LALSTAPLISAGCLAALQGTASALPSGCSLDGATATCTYNNAGQSAQLTRLPA
jgi:hypothetical protein